MRFDPVSTARWLFGPGPPEPGYLWPRWLFLRALGFIFFTAFYSLLFQIRGLIGPQGILPAGEYLQVVGQRLGGVEVCGTLPRSSGWGAETAPCFSFAGRVSRQRHC